MRVKFILPALTEVRGAFWRPIQYSLFPPPGLATLAGYLSETDQATIADEHVEGLNLNDLPDLVVIQVYVTSAFRAYEIADHYRRQGVYVVMGGLHATALPEEAARHADTVCLGPGEDTWPQFLQDFRDRSPQKFYYSTKRSLTGIPPARRDLIKRHLHLVPNFLMVLDWKRRGVREFLENKLVMTMAIRRAVKPFTLSFVCFTLWLVWEMAFDKIIFDPHAPVQVFAGYFAGNLVFVLGYFIGMGLVLEIFLSVFVSKSLSHRIGKALVFFCALDHFFFWL